MTTAEHMSRLKESELSALRLEADHSHTNLLNVIMLCHPANIEVCNWCEFQDKLSLAHEP